MAQQALFRGDQSALAVDVDTAAFQNHAMRREFRRPAGQVQQFARLQRKLVVQLPVLIFGPGIEAPVGDGDGVSCDPLRVTKIGPESRIQIRLVGHW